MNKKIVCHNCNTILSPGSAYCPQCGTKITTSDYVSEETVCLNPIYLAPGTILHMHYKINSVIGQGGFGITYDGTDLKLDMHVAIKEYFPNPMASRQASVSNDVTCSAHTVNLYEQGMNNFLKEARNMAKFAGESDFVSVHDYFAENNTAYIIMEFVEGQNLKQYMQKHGRLTLSDAMPIIMPVMNALEKIHAKNMIHRDVSPSNIMILPDGRIRLLDFGAAKDISLETQNMTTMSAVYKMGYSPIEQLTRDMKQGPYSDIYALCATIYEMLTGSTPPSPLNRLSGSTELIPPSRLGVSITASQEEALQRGLAVNPSERIQTIAELRNALCGIHDRRRSQAQKYDEVSYDRSGILKAGLIGLASLLSLVLVGMVFFNVFSKPVNHGPAQKKDESEDMAVTPEETVQESSVREESTEVQEETVDNIEEEKTEEPAADEEVKTDEQIEAEEEEATQQLDLPDGALSYGGHHYYIYNDASNWENAMERCKERGGYLAVINDSDENERLFEYMVSMGYDTAYFGLTDPTGDWDWQYIYGDNSDFRDWGVNSKGEEEPNNADGDEIHVELDTHMLNGHWNDARFGKQVYTPEGQNYKDRYTYLCEWDQ